MLARLIILFTVIPLIELAILIKLGSFIGLLNTIMIVVVTGIIGASLAKIQGLNTFYKIQLALSKGEMPTGHIIDGFLILAAGLLLLTPGLVTDIFGFLMLIPFTRDIFKEICINYFKKMIDKGEIKMVHRGEHFYESDI